MPRSALPHEEAPFDPIGTPPSVAAWRRRANTALAFVRTAPRDMDGRKHMTELARLLLTRHARSDDQERLGHQIGTLCATARWATDAVRTVLDALSFALVLPPGAAAPTVGTDVPLESGATIAFTGVSNADRAWESTPSRVPPDRAVRIAAAVWTGLSAAGVVISPTSLRSDWTWWLAEDVAVHIIGAHRHGVAEVLLTPTTTPLLRAAVIAWEEIERQENLWSPSFHEAARTAHAILDRWELARSAPTGVPDTATTGVPSRRM